MPSRRELQPGAKPAMVRSPPSESHQRGISSVAGIFLCQGFQKTAEATAGVECGDPELGPQQVRNVPSPTPTVKPTQAPSRRELQPRAKPAMVRSPPPRIASTPLLGRVLLAKELDGGADVP